MTGKPTVRLRRLGERLHQIREDQRLTLAEAGNLLGRSRSSLGKIEKGQVHVPARDVDYILTKYGITDEAQRGEILALARDGRKEGWWTRHHKTLPPSVLDYISMEADAYAVREHQLTLVPGLLQTPDYARAVIGTVPAIDGRRLDREVEIRMSRKQALKRPNPLRLSAVIGEAALHQRVGGAAVLRPQLHYMLDASTCGNVSLRVIPFTVGAHVGLDGAFTILDLADLSIVSLPALIGSSFRESDNEVQRYGATFDRLFDLALSEADSRELIRRIAGEL